MQRKRRPRRLQLTVFHLLLALAPAAQAHPGHGASGLHGGFLHAWLGGEHGLVLAAAVGAGVWLWRKAR
ncbi:MAG: hypothetical protein ACLGI7_01115 [Gammaproteobacteria bacterium]